MAIAEQTLQHQLREPLPDSAPPVATETTRRIQRLVAGFRLLVGLGLLLVALLQQQPPLLEPRYPQLFIAVALIYSLLAAFILALQWRAGAMATRATALCLCVDVIAVALLIHTGGGISSGIGGLLVVLTAAASLSLRQDHALLAAAVSALAVLGEQTLAFASGLAPANAFIPTGVLGAIIFLTTAAANPLARRLQESEALARQRGIDLANLAQLNDYVIQNLRESIVVVDERDQVRLINQSAADLLGATSREPGQSLAELSRELYMILRNWRRGDLGPDSTLGFPSTGGASRINTYFAPLADRDDGPVLLFLEDSTLLAEKVRQTKLAALGRLSASIAHEIRNPVGAM
nr:PAS domain-containing protein [Gammaproteobacteria bacterium]